MAKKTPKAETINIDRLVAGLVDLRDTRLSHEREVETLKEQEETLKQQIYQYLTEMKMDSARVAAGTVTIQSKTVPSVTDWAAFYGYIAKKQAWELLQKRPGERACQERWEAGETIPGVEQQEKVGISLTKSK